MAGNKNRLQFAPNNLLSWEKKFGVSFQPKRVRGPPKNQSSIETPLYSIPLQPTGLLMPLYSVSQNDVIHIDCTLHIYLVARGDSWRLMKTLLPLLFCCWISACCMAAVGKTGHSFWCTSAEWKNPQDIIRNLSCVPQGKGAFALFPSEGQFVTSATQLRA